MIARADERPRQHVRPAAEFPPAAKDPAAKKTPVIGRHRRAYVAPENRPPANPSPHLWAAGNQKERRTSRPPSLPAQDIWARKNEGASQPVFTLTSPVLH